MGVDQFVTGGDVQNPEVRSLTTDDAVVNQSLIIGFSPLEIGDGATANGPQGVAIGTNATADDDDDIAIGTGATADGNTFSAIAIGEGASATSNRNIAIGNGAAADGQNEQTIVGYNASGGGGAATAYGFEANASFRGTAIGPQTTATHDPSVAIGHTSTAPVVNSAHISMDQLVFGGIQDTVPDADLNNGELTAELDETNSAFRLRGKDSGGTIREAKIAW